MWNEQFHGDTFAIQHEMDNSLFGNVKDMQLKDDNDLANISGVIDQRVVEVRLKFQKTVKAYERKVGQEILAFGVVSRRVDLDSDDDKLEYKWTINLYYQVQIENTNFIFCKLKKTQKT